MTNSNTGYPMEGIAIIGMSGRFPGAKNIAEFWENLRNGVESISFFSELDLAAAGVDPNMLKHPDFVNAGGVLEDIELFDASFFGFNPREAETMDPQQRLLLECAWEALEDAGYDPETYDGSIGVYVGGLMSTYLFKVMANRNVMELLGAFQVFTGNDKDHLSTRLSYKLNLKGPSVTVQTACSTSLVAVCVASQSLLDHQCDMALAGGVAIRVPQKAGYLFQEGMIFSRDGHCRPFDAKATGTVFSNGLGLVVLKRLADAVKAGDCIHAVIKGSAMNNDGSLKVGYTAPSLYGQAEVIVAAQAMSGADPETISYIEAHGTATELGDAIEIAALTRAFRANTSKKNYCAVGSVKSSIGHLDAAAGVAGLIKTVLALERKLIPPSLHFREQNPAIDFADSPFYVNTALSEWKAGATPRRAGVSSFGIGGTNAHVVLEEAPAQVTSESSRPRNLLVLSAKSATALDMATSNLARHLKQHPELNLADVAYTCQVGRRAFNHRRVLVCREPGDAACALESRDAGRVFAVTQSPGERAVVFMFPGQGTQRINMASELYGFEPTFRDEVDRCSGLLKPSLGFDLRDTIYPPASGAGEAAHRLEQTAVAQPALFVIEYALAALWNEWGVRPGAMIGHSIGEYVAAVLAGVFSLEDALFVIAERGRLVQRLPSGSMLALPLPEQDAQSLLDPDLQIAAINSPFECVVSGPTDAVEQIERRLGERGVGCRRLHTSHAFHSKMMEPVLEPFSSVLERVKLRPPQIPFVSNVTGTWITASEATNPGYWARQLRQTVRFADGVGCLLKEPFRVLLEVGPGQTLTALSRRHPGKTSDHAMLPSLSHPQGQDSDADSLLNALGRLWLMGARVDWSGFWAHERRRRVPMPTYPFERQRYWIESQPQSEAVRKEQTAHTKKPDVREWFYVPCWRQSLLPDVAGGRGLARDKSRWLVFEDDCGVSGRLVNRLEQEGQTVVRVRPGERFARIGESAYEINAQSQEHYGALLGELHTLGKSPQRIVHLWTAKLGSEIHSAFQSLDFHQTHGFFSLLFLAWALGEHSLGERVRIDVVSSNLQAVTGDEKLCPAKATLLGPCKVIPQEYPGVECRSIDIILPAPDGLAQRKLIDSLIAELATNSSNAVVAFRGNRRWVQTFESVKLEIPVAAPTRLKEGGVYLITGGLGGVGLALAKYLAETVRAKLVLVARSDFPQRSQWEQYVATHDGHDRTFRQIRELQAIEELGGRLMTLRADVADRHEMQNVVRKACEQFGAIHGVIHAAGVAGGGTIQLKTLETAAKVLAPKVLGTLVLDSLFKGARLDFLVLCSSLSSLLGGAGQADYCGANAFLDAFAQQNHLNDGRYVISVNWDTWQVGMAVDATVPRGLEGARREALARGINPAEGGDAFARILAAGFPQVVVATSDFEALSASRQLPLAPPPLEELPEAEGAVSAQCGRDAEGSNVAPSNEIERAIAEIWRGLLGVKQVGVYDNFFELGGNSLLGTQLISQLRSAFKLELPLRSLFEVPTVAGMAERIKMIHWAIQDPAKLPPTGTEASDEWEA